MEASVHPLAGHGPASFRCAQTGCPACLTGLLDEHHRLVPWVIRRTYAGPVPAADLRQEGQIALWQAILHFDPQRGCTFATYAVAVIRHRLWQVVARAQRAERGSPGTPLPTVAPPDPWEAAAGAWQRQAVQAGLAELLAQLPEPRRQILIAAYGLDGQTPRSLAALGRLYGVSRERVRQWRNDALVVLRLPALSGRLRRLCEQNDRAAYQRAQALNRAWLGRRRGGRHG